MIVVVENLFVKQYSVNINGTRQDMIQSSFKLCFDRVALWNQIGATQTTLAYIYVNQMFKFNLIINFTSATNYYLEMSDDSITYLSTVTVNPASGTKIVAIPTITNGEFSLDVGDGNTCTWNSDSGGQTGLVSNEGYRDFVMLETTGFNGWYT